MSPELLVQQLINALSLGSIYALLALGLAMVFSVLGMLNFAFGELVTITGYVMFWLVAAQISFVTAAVAGIIFATVASMLVEQVAFRPLRRAPFVTLLFSSFAVAVIIQNLIRQLISPRPQGVPVPGIFDEVWRIGTFQIGVLPMITLGVGLVALSLLAAFLQRTWWGLAIRAAALDFEVARLMGIRANRVIALAFAISGFLAGVAGVLWVARRGTVTPDMGFVPILKAFIAVVIGGLGNLWGAVLGGFVLAFLEIALDVILPVSYRPFTEAFSLIAVVVILYFRPQGLIATRSGERV
ncbi:MAG TPA: branched-chain amino acid ABC transporter permease [Anaerolineae bacterium]|nr:branched-chain amino acid ABC transporter permease [Anaerolineae bacterium]